MSRPIVTRFAPSPTGYLHIGGARTALFNWYFAKNEARENNQAFRSPYRDSTDMKDAPFAVRFRVPDGETKIKDHVQGDVTWQNASFDDLVLLRADGTPTYMLAVVVDDHDMGVTHVIRGDDHLINAGRQTQLYRALGWDVPEWAHVPLIHGPDGKKYKRARPDRSVLAGRYKCVSCAARFR